MCGFLEQGGRTHIWLKKYIQESIYFPRERSVSLSSSSPSPFPLHRKLLLSLTLGSSVGSVLSRGHCGWMQQWNISLVPIIITVMKLWILIQILYHFCSPCTINADIVQVYSRAKIQWFGHQTRKKTMIYEVNTHTQNEYILSNIFTQASKMIAMMMAKPGEGDSVCFLMDNELSWCQCACLLYRHRPGLSSSCLYLWIQPREGRMYDARNEKTTRNHHSSRSMMIMMAIQLGTRVSWPCMHMTSDGQAGRQTG